MKSYKGESLNKDLLDVIKVRREQLFADGKSAFDNNNEANYRNIGTTDEPKYILDTDEEEFQSLMELEAAFLTFDKTPANKIYEFPGTKVKINGVDKDINLSIRVDQISSLAKIAEKYEKVFSKSIKLVFDNDIYQFKEQARKIEGTDYYPPTPKLVSETDNEYEQRLEEYYKSNNKTKEMREDGIWRKPYPHEQIDFKHDAEHINQSYYSSYYKHTFQENKKAYDQVNHRAQTGQQIEVTAAEAMEKTPLGEKLKNGLLTIPGIFTNPTSRRKLKHGLIVGAAGALGITLVANVPILAAALPTVGLIALFKWGINKATMYRQNKIKAQQSGSSNTTIPVNENVANNEPVIEETKTNEQPSNANEPSEQPAQKEPEQHNNDAADLKPQNEDKPSDTTTTEENSPTPQVPEENKNEIPNSGIDLDSALYELNLDINEAMRIDAQITALNAQLQQLLNEVDTSKKDEIYNKINQLNEYKRQYYENLQKKINQIYSGYGLNQEGGPKR